MSLITAFGLSLHKRLPIVSGCDNDSLLTLFLIWHFPGTISCCPDDFFLVSWDSFLEDGGREQVFDSSSYREDGLRGVFGTLVRRMSSNLNLPLTCWGTWGNAESELLLPKTGLIILISVACFEVDVFGDWHWWVCPPWCFSSWTLHVSHVWSRPLAAELPGSVAGLKPLHQRDEWFWANCSQA